MFLGFNCVYWHQQLISGGLSKCGRAKLARVSMGLLAQAPMEALVKALVEALFNYRLQRQKMPIKKG
ncbi:hypothetical protein GCM10027217_36810 [Pseudomaricurvus hydrocarbonicus]